jgi:hypothetical protein
MFDVDRRRSVAQVAHVVLIDIAFVDTENY